MVLDAVLSFPAFFAFAFPLTTDEAWVVFTTTVFPTVFFSASAFALFAGAVVVFTFVADVVLDKKTAVAVGLAVALDLGGLAVEDLGPLLGRGGLTILKFPPLAGFAGVGLALTGAALAWAAFPFFF